MKNLLCNILYFATFIKINLNNDVPTQEENSYIDLQIKELIHEFFEKLGKKRIENINEHSKYPRGLFTCLKKFEEFEKKYPRLRISFKNFDEETIQKAKNDKNQYEEERIALKNKALEKIGKLIGDQLYLLTSSLFEKFLDLTLNEDAFLKISIFHDEYTLIDSPYNCEKNEFEELGRIFFEINRIFVQKRVSFFLYVHEYAGN